jgi:hypothetical protein
MRKLFEFLRRMVDGDRQQPEARKAGLQVASSLSTALNTSYMADRLGLCSGSSSASPCCSRASGSECWRSAAPSATRTRR